MRVHCKYTVFDKKKKFLLEAESENIKFLSSDNTKDIKNGSLFFVPFMRHDYY